MVLSKNQNNQLIKLFQNKEVNSMILNAFTNSKTKINISRKDGSYNEII
ncbi:MAG: hypothetical protein J1F32_00685 [Erysipelotrichales bacterium]|nr:hypothetical protein [Erysipelotrichales bacterium]